MDSVYGDEESNLNIKRVLLEFPLQHGLRFIKRIFYNYFLRDFNPASIELLAGIALTLSGTIFGWTKWGEYSRLQTPAPTGTVLLATVQVIVGVQLLLSWIAFDLNSAPTEAISGRLRSTIKGAARVGKEVDS
jgi:hypothetical protein